MKEKILSILKNADGYISGERISEELNVSRAAIWKHMKKLRDEGYEIESVTNKGYRLCSVPDILVKSEIESGLKTQNIGKNLVYFDEIDSTNNEAKRSSDMEDGTVFISEIQNGGKGRLGRNWVSPKGIGIWMSILLKPELKPWEVSQITLVAGLAVCKALKEYNAKIKWPNDIIIGSKKICGILTEMSAEMDMVNYVVCGIGINVNIKEFDEEILNKATSLYIETGKNHKRSEIVQNVLCEFEKLYEEYRKNGLKNMIDEYKSYCANINREVQVIYRDKIVRGTAIDVTNTGELVVKTSEGTANVSSGEVSVRGIYGYI